jgi:hypothetical protein
MSISARNTHQKAKQPRSSSLPGGFIIDSASYDHSIAMFAEARAHAEHQDSITSGREKLYAEPVNYDEMSCSQVREAGIEQAGSRLLQAGTDRKHQSSRHPRPHPTSHERPFVPETATSQHASDNYSIQRFTTPTSRSDDPFSLLSLPERGRPQHRATSSARERFLSRSGSEWSTGSPVRDELSRELDGMESRHQARKGRLDSDPDALVGVGAWAREGEARLGE